MTALASPLPRYGTFVFSNLCSERESGDVTGYRLVLHRMHSGDKLAFEYGNGPLERADVGDLRMDGEKLQAQATTADGKLNLEANLSEREAVVLAQFDYQERAQIKPATLARARGLSNRFPTCR